MKMDTSNVTVSISLLVWNLYCRTVITTDSSSEFPDTGFPSSIL